MQEYVTDVTYVRGFERELGPERLRLVAALNGFPTPPADDFDYCELGPAYADTLIVLAASNPNSRFLGIELNRDHVSAANALAKNAGVPNVTLLQRDFSAMDLDDIPDLDFLVMHGVMSWVGPDKRAAILELANRKLKPGGLLYVDYNAMPGWAAIEPLRQLLVSGGGDGPDSHERARKGLALAKEMSEGGAEYFKYNPAARDMIATMERGGLSYIAHEYLNAHWVPLYFAQLAYEMSNRDLHFVGQLPLYSNYRDLVIPPALKAVFERIVDRPTFESLKDFALNEFFRRDIYVKGAAPRAPSFTTMYFADTPFSLTEVGIPKGRSVALPHAALKLEGAKYEAALDALAKRGPLTSQDLGEGAESALLRLLLADVLGPARRPAGAVPAYNASLLSRALTNAGPLVLASPVLGTGIPTTALGALALALYEVPPAERDAWLGKRLEGVRFTIGETTIDDPAQLRERVLAELNILENGLAERLRALGAIHQL